MEMKSLARAIIVSNSNFYLSGSGSGYSATTLFTLYPVVVSAAHTRQD